MGRQCRTGSDGVVLLPTAAPSHPPLPYLCAAASLSLLACGSVYLLGAVTCIGVIKNGRWLLGWVGWRGGWWIVHEWGVFVACKGI